MKRHLSLVNSRRTLLIARAEATMHGHHRTAIFDPRWHDLAVALAALREARHRAVRIVDAECGDGVMLLEAVVHARRLGFTAVEGRGIDASPGLIAKARNGAARLRDPGAGVVFEMADMVVALDREADFPADIVLWHGSKRDDRRPELLLALSRAGKVVIGDPAPAKWRSAA